MAAQPKPLPAPNLPEASVRLLDAMLASATLTWSPTTAYVVTIPGKKPRLVRWFVARALINAGLIEADTPHQDRPRTWALTAAGRQYGLPDRRAGGS